MSELEKKRRTIICDIDGTLIYHIGKDFAQNKYPELLRLAKQNINEWNKRDDCIILITGRKESDRVATERQLSGLGVSYDVLIMGVGRGQRILINDLKPNSVKRTAVAYNLERNLGFENII